jgi:dihydrofolate reductase
MRKLTYGMNVSLDGYVAAPGGGLDWSEMSGELHQYFNDQLRETGISLYGRRMWELMSSYWPTGDEQPGAAAEEIEFARLWRDAAKVVFSSTLTEAGWHARIVRGDAVAEIERLKADGDEPMEISGATIAGAAMRAGLIDEYVVATHPILLGAGTPYFSALDNWVALRHVETRPFPGGVVLTRYEVRR